jgi:hypothetical protein
MDALGFNYLDYAKIEEEAGGAKRNTTASIMKRHAMRSVQEYKKKKITSKKQKNVDEGESSQPGTKSPAPKKQKPSKPYRVIKKTPKLPKHAPETPSASSIGITKILEVMTHPLPFTMLSPLGSYLTSLLQTRKNKNAEEGTGVPSKDVVEETTKTCDDQAPRKKRCIKTMMKVVCKTPPAETRKKIAIVE